MTAELLSPPQELALPQVEGDLTAFNQDVEDLIAALEAPSEGYEFEARLPQVVGWMPEEEARKLSELEPMQENPPGVYTSFAKRMTAYQVTLKEAIPETVKVMSSDIEAVSSGSAQLGNLEVRRTALQIGKRADGSNDGFHTDLPVKTGADAKTILYVFSDKAPTLFYKGPARLTHWREMLELDPTSLDLAASEAVVEAPRLAIVRMSLATVHSAQIANEEGLRIFGRAFSVPV